MDDLPMGTLVNRDVTSKLTNSSLPTVTSLIVSAKCLEFKTCELVLPARGEMMKAMYLESWYEGARDKGPKWDRLLMDLR